MIVLVFDNTESFKFIFAISTLCCKCFKMRDVPHRIISALTFCILFPSTENFFKFGIMPIHTGILQVKKTSMRYFVYIKCIKEYIKLLTKIYYYLISQDIPNLLTELFLLE